MYNSASDAMILADFAESFGEGYSVSPDVPYDYVGMNWAAGRRCTTGDDPGPDLTPPLLWADGTHIHGPYDPHEWRAAIDAHGLPATVGGKTVGNHPAKEI